jgi:hypothetical protein
LIWQEMANRLTGARSVREEFALEAMLRAEVLDLEIVEMERPTRLRALQQANELAISMYDACYLTVAEVTATPLLTLDAHLERAAMALGLGREGGPRRVSEPPARYGDTQVDRTSLAAIGAAIAEMRRQDGA